ncbi:putative nuclease HARBI1 [Tripterygium wilfordii]|uniref:putative nuclease HARBI1 n=1 Tax=Tripterygium wilfordii TaxID=458696 RepID=UPI0018F7E68A|nr:putative nuclease HARBI1 [Tripterygium wilfordii]
MLLEEDDTVNDDFSLLATLIVEEEEDRPAARRGSMPGHAVIHRGRAEGHERLYRDYFAETPTYPPNIFRRRFRMNRSLFLRILSAVEGFDPYFAQKRDAIGVPGLSSLQKVTAALRILAYGASADSVDDYVRIGKSTAIESVKRFVRAIIALFHEQYLRLPNNEDVIRLLAMNERRGFPGMLGSIDCMHWKWKNCPTAWQGMYTGHIQEPTMILEAVASQDLWIWHAFFGLPGSLNDLNVLDRSPLFNELAEGRAPPVNYTINGNNYSIGYYLADGIYPSWSTFVKTIPAPQGNKRQFFAKAQESARKDVERAFGVLQSRFAIVRGPALYWEIDTLSDIMRACVILHNMIVEDERDHYGINFNYDTIEGYTPPNISHSLIPETMEYVDTYYRIRNRQSHSQLQADLVEHLWQLHGGE